LPGRAKTADLSAGASRRRRVHIVAFCAIYGRSTMAQTGVSGLSWWSTEKAFWTRSSRLQAKAEALGSTDYKSTVDVDDIALGRGAARCGVCAAPRDSSAAGSNGRCIAPCTIYALFGDHAARRDGCAIGGSGRWRMRSTRQAR
jgi:hypothetical protein